MKHQTRTDQELLRRDKKGRVVGRRKNVRIKFVRLLEDELHSAYKLMRMESQVHIDQKAELNRKWQEAVDTLTKKVNSLADGGRDDMHSAVICAIKMYEARLYTCAADIVEKYPTGKRRDT